MPIGIDSDQTVDYVLRSDRGKPAERQPKFLLRFITPRQERRIQSMLESSGDEKLAGGERAKLIEAARIGVSGWFGLVDEAGAAIAFDATLSPLDDLLSTYELLELAMACVSEPRLKARDFFVSGWPWESRGAGSAPAENATAMPSTCPAQSYASHAQSAPAGT
jgi:hypothetical protein